MNLGGIKVSSAELEDVAGAVDSIIECAAVAVPPPEGGPDRLVIFVVVSDEDSVDPDALKAEMQDRIRTHLNPLFRIHEVVVVDALPRTASHKVMRRTLRNGYPA
jgi:acetyl-CoA synthetase